MMKNKHKEAHMTEKKEEKKKISKYFKGIGRRKSAVAQARLFVLGGKKISDEEITINSRPLNDFFGTNELRSIVLSPLKSIQKLNALSVSISVRGGGIRGQAEATRLALSRAMVKLDETHKKSLRDLGFLTRDARVVERKKAGLKKARRAPQWQKR